MMADAQHALCTETRAAAWAGLMVHEPLQDDFVVRRAAEMNADVESDPHARLSVVESIVATVHDSSEDVVARQRIVERQAGADGDP